MNTKAKCYNCGAITDEDALKEPSDLFERVEPGDEMPAGECACGALAYIIKPKKAKKAKKAKS